MIVTITSLELKHFFKYFPFSLLAFGVFRQLKKSNAIKYKAKGFWMKHYTISAWQDENELNLFSKSGAHLKAMKSTNRIAKRISIYTCSTQEIPDWNEAKRLLLTHGRVIELN